MKVLSRKHSSTNSFSVKSLHFLTIGLLTLKDDMVTFTVLSRVDYADLNFC
jgi:hypothetical protein